MSTLERPEIRPTSLLTQSWSIARRNFLHIKRMPEMLLDVTIQPVMFVLLFAFVFGGSTAVTTASGSPSAFMRPSTVRRAAPSSASRSSALDLKLM